jgi:hypothetical protein
MVLSPEYREMKLVNNLVIKESDSTHSSGPAF